MEFDKYPCKFCNASKRIKQTICCSADRLHNEWNASKEQFHPLIRRFFSSPTYQCRMNDAVQDEKGE